MKKIKLPKTDRLIGVSAMIVSTLTLIIFIYQTNIINKQSKLSVKPRLSFTQVINVGDSIISLQEYIENKGLGPAIIKKSEIIYKDEDYNLDFREFIDEKFPNIDDYVNLQMTTSLTDLSISPNEKVTIYNLEN